jgi:uncharacterized 2Fe-2S/4Fe-4S cluster protein (DUF4445 family)
MASCSLTFLPMNKCVDVEVGTGLLEAAGRAGIVLDSVCGGEGVCGRCRMIVREGPVDGGAATGILSEEEISQGIVLACQTSVAANARIEIPNETRSVNRMQSDKDARRFRAIQPGITQRTFKRAPLVTKTALQLDEPTLDNNVADAERVEQAACRAVGISSLETGLGALKQIPGVLRENGFGVTASIGALRNSFELLDLEGGDTSGRHYMAVVDIGTSTVVVHLVNVNDMTTVDAEACFNSQSVHGREVTARIMAAEKKGTARLQALIVEDINRLLSAVAGRNGVELVEISGIVCSGNTVMTHFLLGLPTEHIRRSPFIAASIEPPPLKAMEIGIQINPRGLLFCVPGISSWVGGDLTSGILATGLHERKETTMLIDVGTNGEIILGNSEWMLACSASTGPALEGASVDCGMIAGSGAIEKVYIEADEIRYKVIGNTAPEGICGSGIIDLLAVLLDKNIIDRAGRFVKGSHPAVCATGDIRSFVLYDGSGGGREVRLTQEDIENVITAKAAVFAAAKIMVERVNLSFSDVTHLFLAGGFGSYIDRRNAVKIGLLPNLPASSIEYVGNTSIWGAKLAALSSEALDEMYAIRRRTTYYDLLGSDDYVDQFRQAMFLPHTDVELFRLDLDQNDSNEVGCTPTPVNTKKQAVT